MRYFSANRKPRAKLRVAPASLLDFGAFARLYCIKGITNNLYQTDFCFYRMFKLWDPKSNRRANLILTILFVKCI